MYTTHDVSAIDCTSSSDDRMLLYCQIRYERTRGLTGNKEGILTTITVHWQQGGHIDNNNGTLATRSAYWQQAGSADTGGGHSGNNNGRLGTRTAYWQQ